MVSAEKIVQSIKLLIQSGDLSDTPQLRWCHENYLAAIAELNQALEQCRSLADNGALQEARKLNCSFEPALTRQAELLEFPQREEFFAICREYGLPDPIMPDEALLTALSAPASSGEKHLHTLLQEYRKIARSGSLTERISLLRKIVEKLPDSFRWRNDLLSAERGRLQEIEQIIAKLPPEEESLKILEQLYREVLSPEWTVAVKPELRQKFRELLLPLQQSALKRNVEEKLQTLQDLCIEQNISGLRKEFEEWRILCATPQLELTSEQKRAAEDLENFLRTKEEESRKAEEFQALVHRLELKLADNCPYSELAGEHNQLLLSASEYPVSPELLAQLGTLSEEFHQHERLRSIRRTLLCLCCVAAIAIGVIVIFRFNQQQKAVAHLCGNMEKLIAEGKYQEAQELFNSLEKSAPELRKATKVITLYYTAVQQKEQTEILLKQQQTAFDSLLKQLQKLSALDDTLDNASAIDRILENARTLLSVQTAAKQAAFRELETAIVSKRTALKKAREGNFLKFCRDAEEKLKKSISGITLLDMAKDAMLGERLMLEFDTKVQETPYIPQEVKKREQRKLENLCKEFAAAVKREKLRRSVCSPGNLLAYLSGLETCRYDDPELALEFRRALEQLEMWKTVLVSYRQGNIPVSSEQLTAAELENCGDIIRQDLQKLFPRSVRSAEFSRFFADLQALGALKELHFLSAEGGEFYFYTSKELIWERLFNPKRVNLSFYSIEKDDLFSFRYDFRGGKTPLRRLNSPRKLAYSLPERFALPAATDFSREKIAGIWPGGVLTEKFSALAADGPGVSRNLEDALKWLLTGGNVNNAYLKELLILRFLEELCLIQPLCKEAAVVTGKLRNFHSGRNRNWRAPQECADYAAEKKTLEALWREVDLERCLAAAKLRTDFVCAFHARRLMPVGIVRNFSGNRLAIHKFQQEQPAELVVVSADGTHLLSAQVWNGGFSEKDRKHLFTGQVIWSFEDNRTSRDFIKTWEDKALRLNIRLDIRPAICPEGVGI